MTIRNCTACILAVCLAFFPPVVVHAQATYSDGQKYYQAPRATPGVVPASNPATAPAGAQALKPEELEQVVAPIALYPDSLLAQVLMASTYPLEVVQADRWVKQNPTLKDKPDELNKLTWDASVKSLIDFPQVLTMMSEKLDWTVKLGDAFIADQKAVMDTVQRLRGKAYANGNLKSSKEQTVKVEAAPATAPVAGAAAPPQVIVVESSSPSVVYVPTYNPTVVYGAWPYPSYPPYYYTPPGYVAGAALISFGVGVACGAAWGHAWGGCNWHGGEVDIDVNRNVNFNGNINREQARANMDNRQAGRDTRQGERQGTRDTRQANRQGGARSFQHDPSHRQGVAYRDRATTEQFRGAQASQQSAAARDAYRGRAEAGRQELSRGAADGYRGSAGGAGGGSGFGGSSGYGGTYGGGAGAGGARTAGDYRGSGGGSSGARDYSGTRSSGFTGTTSSGSSARAASSRGQTSRSSSGYSGGGSYSRGSSGGYSRGGGGYSGGGARGGGGGMRGGGGRGGGGRR